MSQEKEYFAFISYQRRDEKWADGLRKKLEHYRLPSSLRKQNPSLPKDIRPIFRDALELAGGVLADEIASALQQSKYLIVICSPNSAQSPWVNKEIQTFIDFGRVERIIPFIIDGSPFSDDPATECFPPALRSLRGERELLGININELGRDAAAVKVVARMFGLKFDMLWQRYEREQRQRRHFIIAGMIATSLAISGIAYWMYLQRQETLRANWEMMANQARMVAEKSKEEVRRGNAYDAIVALLEMLPEDGSRPYVAELDEALRMAYDSLQSRRWNHKYLGRSFNRIGFSGNGERILGMDDSSIIVYDSRTLQSIFELKLSDDYTNAMAFLSPGNDTLFVIGNQQIACYLPPSGNSIGQLAFSRQLLDRCMGYCHPWAAYAEDPWILWWKAEVGLRPEAQIMDYNPIRQLVLIQRARENPDDNDMMFSYDLYDCRVQKIVKTIDSYQGKPFSTDNWTYITSTSFSPDGRRLAMIQCLGKGFVIDLDDDTTTPFYCGNLDCAHYSNWIRFGENGQLLHGSDFADLKIFDSKTMTPVDSLPANIFDAELNQAGDVCLMGPDVYYRSPFMPDTVSTAGSDFQCLKIPGSSGYEVDTVLNHRHHITCCFTWLGYEDLQGDYDSWKQTETNEYISKSVAGFLHDNRYVLIIREGIRGYLYGVDVIDIASGIQVYHIENSMDRVYYDPEKEIMAFGFGNYFSDDSAIRFLTLEHLIEHCRELTNGMTLPPETRRRLYLNKQK